VKRKRLKRTEGEEEEVEEDKPFLKVLNVAETDLREHAENIWFEKKNIFIYIYFPSYMVLRTLSHTIDHYIY
jgi:hypothetical protein